jgi:hypothetical protein
MFTPHDAYSMPLTKKTAIVAMRARHSAERGSRRAVKEEGDVAAESGIFEEY